MCVLMVVVVEKEWSWELGGEGVCVTDHVCVEKNLRNTLAGDIYPLIYLKY